MSIDDQRVELVKKLQEINDIELLQEVKWILDRPNKINDILAASVKEGIEQAEAGQGVPHNKAQELYKKWL